MSESNQVMNKSNIEDEGPRENCGVVGIYAPELNIPHLLSLALVALQHRGQESCGIVTFSESGMNSERGLGLVSQVFGREEGKSLEGLQGHLGIAHVRYSTAGKSSLFNTQPVVVQTYHGDLAIAQNGNLTTHKTLRTNLLKQGVGMFKDSDIEVISQILSQHPLTGSLEIPDWPTRISSFMHQSDGAYSLCFATKDAVWGCRDFLGMRPLCIGEFKVTGKDGKEKSRYAIASESCALSMIGATYLREVNPGEIIQIDENGLKSIQGRIPAPQPALCIFEYIYFARPDSLLEDQLVLSVRRRLGATLAKEAPAIADAVIGVPESATPASIGYAEASGLPLIEGLLKNRYVHRTFIQPTHELRQLGVSMKFTPIPQNLKGKRIVLVDDSIVRGNTTTNLVKILMAAGAKEIHLRITSPPVVSPCFMGIDMATTEQMIAPGRTTDEICKMLGATSLKYISQEGLESAVREGLDKKKSGGYCGACFSKKYPLKVDDW